MKVKEVYAIRLNKRDKDLKNYLSQFPQEEQTGALRELINYGISSLQSNYQMQQSIKGLQDSISKLKVEQDKKFNQLMQLLNQNGPVNRDFISVEELKGDEKSIDIDKAKSSIEEALSMFME